MSKLNANAQAFEPETSRAAATRKLNANAEPFTAATTAGVEHAVRPGRRTKSDRDDRSLFMTFSAGSPLTEEEIQLYFTRCFGKCVEHVYLQEPRKKDSEFGKIIFKTPILPEMIMLNRKVVNICVNHKPIWLKKYVPRSQRKLMAQTSEF